MDYAPSVGPFRRLAGLEPDQDVLDVGCGFGRGAQALTPFLTGRYEGIDVSAERIDWCQRNITPKHPNFRFTHIDVFNDSYNRNGVAASEFVFPFADDSFDLVFGVSLFTHLLPADMEHYCTEVRRVLRPGGHALFSFFLLNPATRQTLAQGGEIADALLERDEGDYSTAYDRAEALVAYRQGYVREVWERIGFQVTHIRPGNWREWATGKRNEYTQDLVVAELR